MSTNAPTSSAFGNTPITDRNIQITKKLNTNTYNYSADKNSINSKK